MAEGDNGCEHPTSIDDSLYLPIYSCLAPRWEKQEVQEELPTYTLKYLADPGEARGCSTNSFVIHSFIN